MLDGNPLTQEQWEEWFKKMEQDGPEPAGQSDSDAKRSWEERQK